jgi:hypothetical protein
MGGVGIFSVLPRLNKGRVVHSATLLNTGVVLLAGGSDSHVNPLASAEVYEPGGGGGSPSLTSITVTPAASTTRVGTGMQFIAAGAFSDLKTQILTSVTWSSSDPNVMTI